MSIVNSGISKHYAGSMVSDRCPLGYLFCLFFLFCFFFCVFFFGGGGGGGGGWHFFFKFYGFISKVKGICFGGMLKISSILLGIPDMPDTLGGKQ